MDKKKICFITAIPGTAEAFLNDHMKALQKDYRVYYVSNEAVEADIKVPHDGYHCVDIQRSISLIDDLKGLVQLTRYFRKEKFDIVHSVTPKAGLLTALAGAMAKVPVRIHIFTGQVWATRRGIARAFLKALDKLIARLDTNILVDGEGQRQYLIKNGILKEHDSAVIGAGSICGVNLERFSPDLNTRNTVRTQLGLSDDKLVLVFMGRLNHDKGIYELLRVFDGLSAEIKDLFLLLIGSDEDGVASRMEDYPNVKPGMNFLYYGITPSPEFILQAGDIFVLPTYREGFGSSVIEASALGLPVVCSNAYGVMDAIVDNVTGLRCKVGDIDSLREALLRLIKDPDLRSRLGKAGRERVIAQFDGKKVTQGWLEYYQKLL